MGERDFSKEAITAAMKVHTILGPGLLEEPYKQCLAYELRNLGLKVETEVSLPVRYESVNVELGYRIDIVVENSLIIELKAVTEIASIHKAQLLNLSKVK